MPFRRRAVSRVASVAMSIVLAAVAVVLWPPGQVPAETEVAASYPFSEGVGASAADYSGHSNTATLTGGTGWSSAGRYGAGRWLQDGRLSRKAPAKHPESGTRRYLRPEGAQI